MAANGSGGTQGAARFGGEGGLALACGAPPSGTGAAEKRRPNAHMEEEEFGRRHAAMASLTATSEDQPEECPKATTSSAWTSAPAPSRSASSARAAKAMGSRASA